MAKQSPVAKAVSARTKPADGPPKRADIDNDVIHDTYDDGDDGDDGDDDGEFVPPPPLFPKPDARKVPKAMTERAQGVKAKPVKKASTGKTKAAKAPVVNRTAKPKAGA